MHATALRYLDQVARAGSIRRAAQVLNVTSSAVYRQIVNLEQEVGSPIFERRRDGVRLSSAGEIILRHVRATLSDYKRALSEVAALSGEVEGEVKLLTIRSMIDRFLPGPMAEIVGRHPKIGFRVTGFDRDDTGEKIDIASYDLALIFPEWASRGHTVFKQIRTSVGLILLPSHALAARKSVSIADCADFQALTLDDLWLQRALSETQFAKDGGRLRLGVVANSLPLLRSSVMAGLGIGIFTPIAFMDELRSGLLKFVPFDEPSLGETEISLIAPHRQRLSAPAEIFVGLLVQRLGEFQQQIDEVTRRNAIGAAAASRKRDVTRSS